MRKQWRRFMAWLRTWLLVSDKPVLEQMPQEIPYVLMPKRGRTRTRVTGKVHTNRFNTLRSKHHRKLRRMKSLQRRQP